MKKILHSIKTELRLLTVPTKKEVFKGGFFVLVAAVVCSLIIAAEDAGLTSLIHLAM